MPSTDLVFGRAPYPPGPVNLVFGDEEVTIYEAALSAALPALTLDARAAAPNDATLVAMLPALTLAAQAALPNDASLAAALPALTLEARASVFSGLVYDAALSAGLPTLALDARAVPPNDAALGAALPALAFSAQVAFDSNVSRPLVGQVATRAQTATRAAADAVDTVRGGLHTPGGVQSLVQAAQPAPAGFEMRKPDVLGPMPVHTAAGHESAAPRRASSRTGYADMLRDRRPAVSARSQDAAAQRSQVRTAHQDRFRDRRPSVRQAHEDGVGLRRTVGTDHQTALPVRPARHSRHQEAMRPPAGRYAPPAPPGTTPCYTPSTHLVFKDGPGGTHLVFVCDNYTPPLPPATAVVPVRRVYIVLNDISLRRVVGNIPLPATAISLSIDADSWTWGFSATLPASALPDIEPVDGEPVELEASINGNLYRVLAEEVSTERVFGRHTVQLRGRGKSALLASPYAPVLTFSNSAQRTAQQLMADVLTVNGTPMGWGVDWQLEDWLVPAGAFSVQGSYVEALNAIVGAAGGYLQPHPTNQTLRALLRYPTAPWAWGSVTPDFELPADVTVREGIEWRTKPEYNRVIVSGQGHGIVGQVTRAGTAGELLAPTVTDSLITDAVAARQRGLRILADTGRQAQVSLRLPVLAETGVIAPGKFVRYVDGGTARLGLVRSTSVEASYAQAWQSITVETHA